MNENELLTNICEFYPIKITRAFDNDKKAITALEIIGKELIELFNFFEPAHFKGKFFVIKNLDDNFILPEKDGQLITLNKDILLNKNNDDIIIQVFNDRNLFLWEGIDVSDFLTAEKTLIYKFENDKEFFIANKEEINITEHSYGSRFSNEFWELDSILNKYKNSKIRKSSCPIFNKAWFDKNRIFFKGGGKGIPEDFMQQSLKNFLDDLEIFKGEIGQFEPAREHILGASKPVDIIVTWGKSNRIALIEIKWLGKSKNKTGKIKSTHTNSRANEGCSQLKDYFELAKTDYPNKIIKCYLVVIDGRRWQTNETTQTISLCNGMHYSNKDLEINADKKYWETYPNMEKPTRMFVEPICENN